MNMLCHETETGIRNRRFLVIYNPTAGRRRWDRLGAVLRHMTARALAETGMPLDVTVRATRGRRDAQRLAATAGDGTYDVVVAAGGDGTINEVANGLIGLGAAAPALGLVPLGTANVLAGELGLPVRVAGVADGLLYGRAGTVHTGLASGRLFTMMAGVGVDAHVVAGIDPAVKRRLGKGAYALGALARIASWSSPRYRVELETPEGERAVVEAGSCIIAKGHYYGGRYVCAPAARLDDPLFQVCLFRHPGRLAALGYSAATVCGVIAHMPGYEVRPARRVWVSRVGDDRGRDMEPVQADGDLVAPLPLAVEPGPPLRVLLPLPVR